MLLRCYHRHVVLYQYNSDLIPGNVQPISIHVKRRDPIVNKLKRSSTEEKSMQEPINTQGSVLPGINGDDEIKQNYKRWKKNAPYIYDTLITTSLPWPSLTCQWFPDIEQCADGYDIHRILLGTQTSGQGDEFLRIGHVKLPRSDSLVDLSKYDPDLGEVGGYKNTPAQVQIHQKILHSGEINRARYMPQNFDVLATFSSDGNIYVFDRTKHPLQPRETFQPDAVLNYHQDEGYGLSWNPHTEGLLVSGSSDTQVALWDITKLKSEHEVMNPISTWQQTHDLPVNEVEFSPIDKNMFGCVSDAGKLTIHDIRSNDVSQSATLESGHALNTLAFNKANEHLIATGGTDNNIILWDLRKLPSHLHTLKGHSGSIVALDWSPRDPTILASASIDQTAILWDASRIGTTSTSDTPPEMVMIHAGHSGALFDLSWNCNRTWMLATTAEDNRLDVWEPSRNIVLEA